MTVTTTALTRAAGLCAVAAGTLFIAVQIKHPNLDAGFVTSTEYTVREGMKIAMAVLSLVGITGMYLRQVRQMGVLGLIGYLLFGAGYLTLMTVEMIGTFVLPHLATSSPGYVDDVLVAAVGGHPAGDIGGLTTLLAASGATFILGGLVFGIALFRAGVLARWAAALLAVGSVATLAIPLLPQVNYRLFSIPTSIAMIGLGWSLWRDQRPDSNGITVDSVPALDAVGSN